MTRHSLHAALLLLIVLFPVATQVAAQQSAMVYRAIAVDVYPHDTGAFTQGLVYHDGFLYEGTGLHGESSIRKVDLETGEVLQQRDLDKKYFGEGIAIHDNQLVQVTYLNREGFVYDLESFDVLHSFRYTAQGWGLASDGDRLILSDGASTLRFLDPVSYAVTGELEVWSEQGPLTNLNELEVIDGVLWANVYGSMFLAQIDLNTGQVLSWVDCGDLLTDADYHDRIDVLNGIAYDAENHRIFVTGKRWPKVFEIELVPAD